MRGVDAGEVRRAPGNRRPGRSRSRASCRACRRRPSRAAVVVGRRARGSGCRASGSPDREGVAVVGGDDDQRVVAAGHVERLLDRLRRRRPCRSARGRRCRRGGRGRCGRLRPSGRSRSVVLLTGRLIAASVISASDGSPPVSLARSASYSMWLVSKSPSTLAPVAAGRPRRSLRCSRRRRGCCPCRSIRRSGRGRRCGGRSCPRPPGRPCVWRQEVAAAAAERDLEAVAGRPVRPAGRRCPCSRRPARARRAPCRSPSRDWRYGRRSAAGRRVRDARGRDDAGRAARRLGHLEQRRHLVALLRGAVLRHDGLSRRRSRRCWS